MESQGNNVFNDELIGETNWIEYFDKGKGKPYYFNKQDKTTSWKISQEYLDWKFEELQKFCAGNGIRVTKWNEDGTGTIKGEWNEPLIHGHEGSTIKKTQEECDALLVEYTAFLIATAHKRRSKRKVMEKELSQGASHVANASNITQQTLPSSLPSSSSSTEAPTAALASSTTSIDDDRSRFVDSFDGRISTSNENVKQSTSNTEMEIDRQESRKYARSKEVAIGPESLVSTSMDVVKEQELAGAINRETALVSLQEIDSIMKVDVEDNVTAVLAHETRLTDEVINLLSDNYVGYAAMVRWTLAVTEMAKSLTTQHPRRTTQGTDNPGGHITMDRSDAVNSAELDTDAIVREYLTNYAKAHFDGHKADLLVSNGSILPPWFSELMTDSKSRRMLIELNETHKNSALLGKCLKQLSIMGYHRDIARVVHEVELFDVFSRLFVDMVTSLLNSSYDVQDSDESRTEACNEVVSDLSRLCCQSEFAFIYAYSVIEVMRNRLEHNISMLSGELVERNKWLRWRRIVIYLRQEMENTAIWRKRDEGTLKLNSAALLASKITGTFSRINGDSSVTYSQSQPSLQSSEDDSIPRIGSVLVAIVRDKKITGAYVRNLHAFCDALVKHLNDRISFLDRCTAELAIMQHQEVLPVLIDAFIHPQKQLGDVGNQLALVFSVIISMAPLINPVLRDKYLEDTSSILQMQVHMCEQYLETRKLCSEISKMAFGVISYPKIESLLHLMASSALISTLVLCWTRALIHDSTVNSKPTFLALLPSVFQIVVAAIEHHACQREECFRILEDLIALTLTLSSSEKMLKSSESYTSVSAQKDAMDCMFYLMGVGYNVEPMAFLLARMHEFDGVMVRHILQTMLTSFQPPFSRSFAKALTALLHHPNVVKAADSVHFQEKDALHQFSMSVASQKLAKSH